MHASRRKLTSILYVGEKSDKGYLLSVIHEILRSSSSLDDRYCCMNCTKLLLDNCHETSVEEINALIEALKILEKYGKNLLRNDRPEHWKVVRLSNVYFHDKVDNIIGSRCILQQMGYTDEVFDGLAFPPSVNVPDKKVVSLVTSDIILLKYELFLLSSKQHPNPNTILPYMNKRKPLVAPVPQSPTKALDDRPSTSRNTSTSYPEYHYAEISDCVVCGQKLSDFYCPLCNKQLCASCDQKWHSSRERVNHERKSLQALSRKKSKHKSHDNVTPSILDQPITENIEEPMELKSMCQPGVPPPLLQKSHPSYPPLQPGISFQPLNYGLEASVNWDERFEGVKKQLTLTIGVGSRQKLVDQFCHDVDKQVRKFTDKSNGLGEFANQHFQERAQYLLVKQFELKKYLLDLCKFEKAPQSGAEQEESGFFREVRYPSDEKQDSIFSPNLEESNHVKTASKMIDKAEPAYTLHDYRQTNLEESNHVKTASKMIDKAEPAYTLHDYRQTNLEESNHVKTASKMIDKAEPAYTLDDYRQTGLNKTVPANQILSFKKERYRLDCLKTIDKLRVAEAKNCSPLEMQIALQYLPNNTTTTLPSWLSQNLEMLVHPLVEEYPCVTFSEACKVFNDNDGNMELTRKALHLQHSLKLRVLLSSNLCSTQEAEDCLNRYNGSCCKALVEMQKPLLQNFLSRLQTPPKENFLVEDFVNVKDDDHLKNALMAICAIKETLVVEMMSSIMMQCFHSEPNSASDLFKAMQRYDVFDVYEAAKSFPDCIESALKYLGNQCSVCLELFPQNKLECMTACGDNGCTYCQNCLARFLEVKIQEGHIRDLVCPVCKLPDIDTDDEAATNHFSYLDVVVKKYVNEQTHAVYQKKLRDRVLMKTPNFRWCSHCENGFVYERNENHLKMVCSACNKATCFSCKKKWEAQHEGLTCQAFLEWKQKNDPEIQAKGLAAHLEEHGIDCPTCNFRYELAKGGCIHFKCLQCSYQFCSGCKSPFKQGQVCPVSRNCVTLGLHAHHPRDCLFYLRDLEIARLQQILSRAKISFRTESKHHHRNCQVPEQKEIISGLVDDVCGREVSENNADLCEIHYKEYLVNLINSKQLDPAEVFSIEELEICLRRSNEKIPSKSADQTDCAYKLLLLQMVKKLPLIHQKGTNGEGMNAVSSTSFRTAAI